MTTRILYVADSLMAGGIESQLVELVTRLDRTAFEPHMLCLYGPRARDLHFAPRVRAAGIPLYLPDLGWGSRDKARGVARIVSAAWSTRPQIIQAEGYHANLLTRLAFPFLPPVKLIGSLRGMHTKKQMLYERLSHWTCARIVVNAPHLKASLIEHGRVPARKVVDIPNGITIDRYASPQDPELRDRIAPRAHRVFVSMGRISFEKNMHWIVEALGIVKRRGRLPAGVRLFIVGPVQDRDAQTLLHNAINGDDLGEVVEQHPATDHPEDYYHACDVSILYSPAEGLPNVCLESLAAGRPVIISDSANAAGVIEHGVTGWVVPTGDPQRLANTLEAVMAMPEPELARMRRSCSQQAEQYSVQRLVERYTDFYTATLATGEPRYG